MEIYEKIKQLRREKNLTLEQVGDYVGVGKSTVRKWENGIIKNMRRDKIAKLAIILGTTPAYLMGWKGEADLLRQYGALPIKTKKVPMLGAIACGRPIYADEEKGHYVDTDETINADYCLRCKGDSMTGARINDGDIVFLVSCNMVDNGDIAAVIIDNEVTLKRVYYYPSKNKIVLNAENPKYEPYVFVGEELEQIRIIGKAVSFQSIIK